MKTKKPVSLAWGPGFFIVKSKSSVRNPFQLIHPSRCLAIAGRTPVSTRGKRTSRSDFRRVGHTSSLELTGLKKAPEKNLEPSLYVVKGVFMLL
jgi:hypothetical protein